MIWPLVVITFKEGLRNRVFQAVAVLASGLFLLTATFSTFFARDVVKVAVDLALSGTVLAGLLLTIFVGNALIAKDLDRRTVHMVLSRPVSRGAYIVGRFLGLVALIVTAMFILGALAALSIAWVDRMTSDTYGVAHWPEFGAAIGASTVMLIVLAAIGLFLASSLSNSFLALALTIAAYFIGASVEQVKLYLLSGELEAHVPAMLRQVVLAISYIVPNLAAFDLKLQAAHGLPIASGHLAALALYGVSYATMLIVVAAWIFGRREFP
ncbi:MAG: ABC transporter permease subunit [Nitrospiria bacterium]